MLMVYTLKLTGKSIGSNMIRKIYVSWVRKDELSIDESKSLARCMMHSEKIQRELYRKV